MRIDRLRVQNFRCFDDREWTFAPGFNVLIGDNGAGKSALLDALAISLDPVVYKAKGMPARVIRPDDTRLSRMEPQFPVIIKAGGGYEEQQIEWERTLSGNPNAKTTIAGTKVIRHLAQTLFAHKRSSEPLIAPVISYYTSGRLWRQKREKLEHTASPGSKLRGYDFALDAKANNDFLFRWFKTTQLAAMQSVFEKGSHYDPLLQAIRFAIAECMEGDRKYMSFDIAQNAVVVADEGGHDRLPFRMLSDGQRNIAALVLDLGYRCATLNPHLGESALAQTPGVVLIDEIDLHLHPKWQRRIAGDLRAMFPRVQFIASTHSPIILQNLSPATDCVIDLSKTSPHRIGDFADQPVEDVLIEQGYEEPHLSARRQAMIEAAEEYYLVLKRARKAEPAELDRLKRRMDELALPYADNAAYIAFLNMERRAELGGKA